MDINTDSEDKVQIIPDEYCLAKNPNMYMYTLFADLSQKTKHSVTPFMMVNLSTDQYLEFPKNHVVAFAQKDDTEGEVFQIEQVDTTLEDIGSHGDHNNQTQRSLKVSTTWTFKTHWLLSD